MIVSLITYEEVRVEKKFFSSAYIYEDFLKVFPIGEWVGQIKSMRSERDLKFDFSWICKDEINSDGIFA